MIVKKIFFIAYTLTFSVHCQYDADLTLIGHIINGDGIGQIIPNIINALNSECKIKYVPSKANCVALEDLSKEAYAIATNPKTFKNDKVNLYCHFEALGSSKKVPDQINIAYSMCETTEIHISWVHILNSNFDIVVVPDKSLVDVYKKCGVKTPIFVLPIIINLEKFLELPIKKISNKPFVFGCSAAFWERKNHLLLIDAFFQAFGNNENIKLKFQGRSGEMLDKLKQRIKLYNANNIEINQRMVSRSEYEDFLKSLDCFVLVSKGEGFSIPPREAMALGIPCILTNNTAQQTICNSGFVKVVKSDIVKSALNGLASGTIGLNFDCDIKDVISALKDVYYNYNKHLETSVKGRGWVKQYIKQNIKHKYLNLVKPKKILLGKINQITDNYIMTNSESLYKKYLFIFK